MALDITQQVKKDLLQNKTKFTRTLSSQLGLCANRAAHFRNSQKFRNWIAKNVFQEYTPNIMWHRKISSGEGFRILKAFYGTSSTCDIGDFIEYVKGLGVIFDVFGQDSIRTINAVKSWLEHKGITTPGAYFLQAAVLYAQLSYMGHRVNEMGYGSHNLIATATAERAYTKRVAAETARKEAADKIHLANLAGEVPEMVESNADTQARNALAALEIDWD
uniref:Uncharacterized protein n=1 Tax=viral metagenome TaxID=1070528 RepID=A0A6C0KES2_9ZZZZ